LTGKACAPHRQRRGARLAEPEPEPAAIFDRVWHALRLAGVSAKIPGYGRLLREH
jgi:hypothetical protein